MPASLRGRTQTASAPPPETADVDLVQAAQTSPRAFAPLYLRYRDSIMNYCYYRLGDREESEDATSVIFVKALDHLSRFVDRDDSFRTWLFRIAHNEIADRHRHRGRHVDLPLDLEQGLRDPAAPLEEAAIAVDDRNRVRQLLAALPPRERAVLELRIAELSTREIAEVLQINEQSVRTAQSRAVSRLRVLMMGDMATPEESGNA